MDNSRVHGVAAFKRSVLLALFVFSIGAASAQGPEIKESRRYLELDQPAKAISTLTSAVAKYPQDPGVNYQLGLAQIKANQLDAALATFEKGIKLNEKDGQNLAGKGHVLLLKGNASEAQALFTKALALSKSKDGNTLKAVAEAKLSKSANADEVIALGKKALNDNAKDEQAFIILGDAFLAKNQGGQAVTQYEYAASANPKSGYPHYKIGLVYQRSKNNVAAEEAFKKAIEVDPDYTLAHKELGEMYYLDKRYMDAVKAYENYLRLSEKPKDGQLRMAFFYFSADMHDKADPIFKELMKDPNVSPMVLRYYAYSLFKQGKLEESSKMFAEYFKKAGKDEVIAADYKYLGDLQTKLGQDSLAVASYRQSFKRDTTQKDLLRTMAETFYKGRKYDSAIATYNQLFELTGKPGAKDLYTLGQAYMKTEQYTKADTAFQQVAASQPESPNSAIFYLMIARAKAYQDPESEQGLAKPFYEKYISMIPTDQVDKNKATLIESYKYLGYYHFIKKEYNVSKTWWQKVLALDSNDKQSKEALDAIAGNAAAKAGGK
jgi:tetratricopeptide (TPR) repeat protein